VQVRSLHYDIEDVYNTLEEVKEIMVGIKINNYTSAPEDLIQFHSIFMPSKSKGSIKAKAVHAGVGSEV
jgi:hypothetical protein